MSIQLATLDEVEQLHQHFTQLNGDPAAIAFLLAPSVTGASLESWLATPANLTSFRQLVSLEAGVAALTASSTAMAAINGSATAAKAFDARANRQTGIRTPTNVTPTTGQVLDIDTPTLTGTDYRSLYGAPQGAIQVQVSGDAAFSTLAYDSGSLAPAASHRLPTGNLSASTTYYWRLRHKSVDGDWSAWSEPTTFVTASAFVSVIPTPAATPANFGDAFEGGFYAGMVWQQVTTSASSKTLATGTQVFAVPDMSVAPAVYIGQQIEVRSRANPSNKFIGTVTGAYNTGLTLSVSSIGGSGTFSDWSVMARHRVIVAPKASGENAGIALKNANSAFPSGCQSLVDGWVATNAMKSADTSTVYPAAYWARGLSIGGRTDWYIPAMDELELCWRNLKPVTDNNYVTADRPAAASFDYKIDGAYGDTSAAHGTNPNSAPGGSAYTASVPGQTTASAFKSGGAEAFSYGSEYYWSSTEYNASGAWLQRWYSSGPGNQGNSSKTTALRVRAVRRSII